MWVSNLTSTAEWPVTIVNQILKQMPGLAKPQAKFIEVLISTILALRGRVNYRNLSRYCHYSERSLARQFQRQFDWPMFNLLAMGNLLKPSSTLIAAQDATFIPKSGKKTYGLDHFFNSSAGRAERGLELSTLAIVDVTRSCAYTLAATQTPPQQELAKADKQQSRVDFYLAQLREHRQLLPQSVKYIEFIFRDAKQFTGLSDCQSRKKEALGFHFNASLATLNLARVEAVNAHQSTDRLVFSMASRKQLAFNERFIKVISEQLAIDLTVILNHESYDNLRTYGAIAA